MQGPSIPSYIIFAKTLVECHNARKLSIPARQPGKRLFSPMSPALSARQSKWARYNVKNKAVSYAGRSVCPYPVSLPSLKLNFVVRAAPVKVFVVSWFSYQTTMKSKISHR